MRMDWRGVGCVVWGDVEREEAEGGRLEVHEGLERRCGLGGLFLDTDTE